MTCQKPERLKVLIAAPCQGSFGGIEAVVLSIAREMRQHPDIRVAVCFKKVQGFHFRDSLRKSIIEAGVPVLFAGKASGALRKLIRSADVVHSHNSSPDIILPAKFYGKPLAITAHNWRRKTWNFTHIIWRLTHPMADRHWYNSDFVWDSWEGQHRRPTSAKLPIVSDLPTGVVPAAERQGFIFVARWIANKGLEILLDAYARAEIDHRRHPLTLVGDGPMRGWVEAKIARERIAGIQVKGFVSMEERNRLIRHSRWMVTPPNTKEDFGLTPIEARHVGVPCIITRDGGLPEAGGRHALACDPNDPGQLQVLLERAARMPEAEYQATCDATRLELIEYLKPMSLYYDNYWALYRARHERAR